MTIVGAGYGGVAISYGNKPIDWVSERDWPLMQYAGLKDKNGVEIYSGDIVKKTHNKHHWIGVIECASEQFGNALFYMGRFSNCGSDGDRWNWEIIEYKNRDYVPSGKNCEVIGNIYSNPELIEKVKI